jgi:predicted AAA+ superfamily ATPase
MLVNVGDLETFERFLKLCAGRTGQILNFASLANDCGVSVDTARRWISILKTSFIVFFSPRIIRISTSELKSPKLFFCDTGLASHLLGIRTDEQLDSHPAGSAFRELRCGRSLQGIHPSAAGTTHLLLARPDRT